MSRRGGAHENAVARRGRKVGCGVCGQADALVAHIGQRYAQLQRVVYNHAVHHARTVADGELSVRRLSRAGDKIQLQLVIHNRAVRHARTAAGGARAVRRLPHAGNRIQFSVLYKIAPSTTPIP